MKMRNNVTSDQIRVAKQMDLLTFLQTYEPDELVRAGTAYRTRTHDSLKISNGLWHWFSRGIGGKTALDYLIHVKEMDFVSAVNLLSGNGASTFVPQARPVKEPPREQAPFELPKRNKDNEQVREYLSERGVDNEVIDRCINEGMLYESQKWHNAVFVGYDDEHEPRYAMMRAATFDSDFKIEADGSDKRFSFAIEGRNNVLVVSESAIDTLSSASLYKLAGKEWKHYHYLSLGGIAAKYADNKLPIALEHYLAEHTQITKICLMLDNDIAGRAASCHIMQTLMRDYEMRAIFPKHGKDFNDELIVRRADQYDQQRKPWNGLNEPER